MSPRRKLVQLVKTKRRVSLAVALALSGGCGSVPFEEPTLLSVPPFAITAETAKFQFERPPEEIYRCEDLSERRGLVFVFGKVHAREADYYLLGGWSEAETDSPVPVYESQIDEGTLVLMSQQGCRTIGLTYALSTGDRERRLVEERGFSDQVIEALVDDAIERQIRMFGGRDQFLCQPDIADYPTGWDPLLRKKLEQLGKPSKPCK